MTSAAVMEDPNPAGSLVRKEIVRRTGSTVNRVRCESREKVLKSFWRCDAGKESGIPHSVDSVRKGRTAIAAKIARS